MNSSDPAGWRMKQVGGNVLFIVGFGSWDAQVARDFSADYQEKASPFAGRSWAVLGDACDWNLENQAVQEILRDLNRWSIGAGCRTGSFYTGAGALNRLLLYRLVEPDSDQFRFRVHPHRRRAVEALAEDGYEISGKQLDSFFRGEGTRP